ncbi:MAG TPA: hypothetical protein PLK30_00725 [Blastocatellia bacterium]|nr:hypothetical protein [Blastocatellia bacterium]
MTESKFENFLDEMVDSFWACLPEEAADNLATFKKDVLKGFRSAVDSFVDTAVAETDRHVENARKMREEWRANCAAEASDDTPPNPAAA